MVPDIEILKSHPKKRLLEHIQGVIDNSKKLTSSRFVELVAIFHDLGKINPNFQNKFIPEKTIDGYSNHAYLSAYSFFCAFCYSERNLNALIQFLGVQDLTKNDIIALAIAIAKHHGNLPDFTPADSFGAGTGILSREENYALFKFIEKENKIPINEFVKHFIPIEDFQHSLLNSRIQQLFSEKLVFMGEINESPLDFFIDYQFIFSCLIQADKADAGDIGNIIDEQKQAVFSFSEVFAHKLNSYLEKLNQSTKLNQLRTLIRNHAIENIREGLKVNRQIFELTAPTGSGKTLMMLSLASEIIKAKGAKRIIYVLPFLSITEQVEDEVLKIFEEEKDFIQRIDSKSENHRFEKIQAELDCNPTEENIQEANILEFQENTFAYPFIITTFVRFFETLLSNRNAELLKLPNFSNCIFLLDEIQTLPPRLYGFFSAYLSRFCEKFGSYAIISTATQPNFELPKDNMEAQSFFKDYTIPAPLLPLNYFENNLFNRYQIEFRKEPISLEFLKDSIISERASVLVILNTIDDTKELYKLLRREYDAEEIILLNTHFTPLDRKRKIYLAKQRLEQNQRVIVISTQLIEAGVDIDFPVLYRDFATVASIVQSAGRCNRNGKLESLGQVKLFKLQKNGKNRSELIYQGANKDLLRFTNSSFVNNIYQEKELIAVQRTFFNRIQSELNFAKHSQNSPKEDFDFIKDIRDCMYEKVGKFQIIDRGLFGIEMQYYVPRNDTDRDFENLLDLQSNLIELFKEKSGREQIKNKKRQIELLLKKMSEQIVQVRLKKCLMNILLGSERHYFNLYKLDSGSYTFDEGIDLIGSECIL